MPLRFLQEEEDSRIYGNFADGLREAYPATAKVFEEMQAEESRHRQRLIERHQQRFGEHIPLIRRQDVKGFIERRPVWLARPLGIKAVRREAEQMEFETRRFYERALQQISDAETRKLLGDLAQIEQQHGEFAAALEEQHLDHGARVEEEKSSQRIFMLQVVQPGLAGLMDGSVSTLAPIFAAAFATHQSRDALLVGLAASVGAGISMAFAEALSDDGSLTWSEGRSGGARGLVTGAMTAAGGLGHTLPFLVRNFHLAFAAAVIVVAIELAVISYVRHRYMDTPLVASAFRGGCGEGCSFLRLGSSLAVPNAEKPLRKATFQWTSWQ